MLSEFLSRDAVRQIGAEGRFGVARPPISIEGHYVMVSKDHPRADALLALVIRGLAEIRESGSYQEIVDRHMSLVCASQ